MAPVAPLRHVWSREEGKSPLSFSPLSPNKTGGGATLWHTLWASASPSLCVLCVLWMEDTICRCGRHQAAVADYENGGAVPLSVAWRKLHPDADPTPHHPPPTLLILILAGPRFMFQTETLQRAKGERRNIHKITPRTTANPRLRLVPTSVTRMSDTQEKETPRLASNQPPGPPEGAMALGSPSGRKGL